MTKWYGGIEAGGTKFVCAVGQDPDNIRAQIRIPTTTPAEVVPAAIAFFQQQAQEVDLAAVGIASFGPIDPNPTSPTWGNITSTPKPHWGNANLAQAVRDALGVPVGFDTDVNGAALGEHLWGAAQGLDTFVYYTIGTGVGGGGMVGGQMMHGLVHPEMGHMAMAHDLSRDPYAGHCPYHKDCFEGLASGPAMAARWGISAENLPPDHPAWDLEAGYIAQALRTTVCMLSPQRIILGGGVMQQAHLFPLIRSKLQQTLNGYIQHPTILNNIDSYIVPPALGNRAGVLGAIALGIQAC